MPSLRSERRLARWAVCGAAGVCPPAALPPRLSHRSLPFRRLGLTTRHDSPPSPEGKQARVQRARRRVRLLRVMPSAAATASSECLGAGGKGIVYQAWDEELGVAVLKVIRPEVSADPIIAKELEKRFKRELLLARKVSHHNVVRIRHR